jgi:uncharacterized protein with GYD domain
MWKVTKRQELVIEKGDAVLLLEFDTYPAQRPLNQKHLDQIKRALLDDTFRTGSVAVATLWEEEKGKKIKIKILVNGHHQLVAIKETDKTMVATYEEIECETWEDVAQVYGTYDQGGAKLLRSDQSLF